MFHWFGVVTNTKGDSLPNWQVECVQLADGVTVVPIYADENLTPILTTSGIADRAKSDSSGNYDFFVPEGTYSLRFYDANGVFQRLQRYLPMYGNAPEAAIAAMEDAQAAQAAAEVAQGLAEDAQAAAEAASELAQTTAGGTVYATWADLAAATGMTAGDSAVVFEDAGTHTDPVVGGTVANAGIYIYSASPAGWERVADTEAVKAADSADLAQAWAEGTLPGGAGTKSAKEHATDAAASASEANAATGPLTEALKPLADFLQTTAAVTFQRGDFTLSSLGLDAGLKGWRSPFKSNGGAFNVIQLNPLRALAANTRGKISILDASANPIAVGYAYFGTAFSQPMVVLNRYVRLTSGTIGYVQYEPDGAGALSYPGGRLVPYPAGDADTSVYLERYLDASNVWQAVGTPGDWLITFRCFDFANTVTPGTLASLLSSTAGIPTLQTDVSRLSASVDVLADVVSSGSSVAWENPGFTGYNSSYTQAGVGTASGTMSAAVLFNRVTVYGGINGSGFVRGYLVTPGVSNPHIPSAVDTLLFEQAVSWTSAVAKRVVDLDQSYTVPAGKILWVLWRSATAAQTVSIARFTSDPGAAAPVLSYATTNAGTDAIWSASWTAGIRSFCTVPPLLEFALAGSGGDAEVAPFFTIPATIFAVVGQELNLYHDAIFSARSDGLSGFKGYQVTVVGSKGQNKQRCFRFTPVSGDVGTHTFTATARDGAGNIVVTKAFAVQVVAASPKGSAKNVLLLGDSVTNNGSLPATAQAKLAALGATVPTFVGSQGTSPAKHEGRPGWAYGTFATAGGTAYRFTVSGVTSVTPGATYTVSGVTYTVTEVNLSGGSGSIRATGASAPPASGTLTKATGAGDATIAFSASATEAGNPFWNGSAVSVSYYRTNQSIASVIDYVSMQLGINEILGETVIASHTATINYIKTLIDAFIADNASCKINVQLPTISGNTGDGFAANYGGSYSRAVYEQNAFALRAAILAAFDNGAYHANVLVGAVGLTVDRYYGYTLTTTTAAARLSDSVQEHTNAVHPGTGGYLQAGDQVYAETLARL